MHRAFIFSVSPILNGFGSWKLLRLNFPVTYESNMIVLQLP